MNNFINILIVEDRHDDAEIMALALESSGFEIVWHRVETPEEFQARLNTDVDVILADYSLPRFNASQALALLQQSKSDAPLIVVTGTINEETALAILRAGAADYLLKDRLSRLGEAVRHAIHQRDMHRAQREAERNLIVMGQAIETSTNAFAITNLSGEITYANRAFLDLCPNDEVHGKTFEALWGSEVENFHQINDLTAGKSVQGQFSLITRSNKSRILQYSASSVFDAVGIPICFMSTFIDVTEQIEAERTRHEAYLLRIDLEKERELRELKTNFISMLVHDFRNPLAVIQTTSYMIAKLWGTLTIEQLNQRIDILVQQANRLNSLIDDALMVGKMEFISNQFNASDVDINLYCKEIFDEFIKGISHEKYQFSYLSDVNQIYARVDSDLFRRAIVNLLTNSVKYSPHGGEIGLRLRLQEQFIVIDIFDHGIGIPPEDRKRLFEGFYRASNVGAIEGTGLGLAIVKQVIEVHGGTIDCQSEVNKGTTFIIKLPQK